MSDLLERKLESCERIVLANVPDDEDERSGCARVSCSNCPGQYDDHGGWCKNKLANAKAFLAKHRPAETEEMKLCVDCASHSGGGFCSVEYKSCVSGNVMSVRACSDARSADFFCGASAKHFKAKVVEPVKEYTLYEAIQHAFDNPGVFMGEKGHSTRAFHVTEDILMFCVGASPYVILGTNIKATFVEVSYEQVEGEG